MAPLEDTKCDVTVHRGHTGAVQTFTLRTGGVLRIGRGIANDIVLDYAGVSVYHAELYLRPNTEPGQTGQLLCVRDESKNGSGVRAGPHAQDADGKAEWEPLKKGGLRVLEHGWQLLVPMRSRKENLQMPEAARILTVYMGTKVGPEGEEELDGEVWEPMKAAPIVPVHVPIKSAIAPPDGAPPPPPDLGGGAFEEAPPPPGEVSDDDREARKREKKEKKAKKRAEAGEEEEDEGKKEKKDKKKKKREEREREEQEAREREEEERAQRRREKKEKKAAKKREKEGAEQAVEEEEEAEEAQKEKDAQAQYEPKEGDSKEVAERKRKEKEAWEKRKREREERERLEQELEDELAEELLRKERLKKKDADKKQRGDEETKSIAPTGAPTEPGEDVEMKKAPKAVDDSEVEEEDDMKSAWNKALAPEAKAKAAAAEAAPKAVVAALQAAAAASAAPAEPAKVPAVVEVLDVEAAGGIFIRNGVQGGQPMYRRLRDEKEPVFLYFWDGGGDASCAGWYVAANPSKQGHDDYQEFWAAAPALPVPGKGENGARMEVHAQLDGPALQALSELPEKLRKEVRTAFGASTSLAAKGVAEEETGEAVADLAAAPEQKGDEAMADAGDEAAGDAEAAAPAAVEPEAAPASPRSPSASPARDAEAAEAGKDAEMKPAEDAAKEGAAPMEVEEKGDEGAAEAEEGEAAAEPTSAAADAESAKEAAEGAPTEPAAGEPTEPAAGEPTEPAAGEPTEPAAGEATEPAITEKPVAEDDDAQSSRMSLTTAPQKTVPGDRGESVAPTIPPGDRGESMPPETEADPIERAKDSAKEKHKGGLLTAEALALHTAALAKAQAEAYAATFAQARSRYTRSVAGRSVAGRSITGMSIAGKSIAGKSIAGKSIAGKSIAASGIVPSERTFRTHMTTRELLVGASQMRELMRSVSPISEPGVPIKRKRRPSPARSGSPSQVQPRKKKAKRGKVKLAPRKGISPSHYAPVSPTPYRGRAEPSETPDNRVESAAPSHFKGMDPSASEEVERETRPKKVVRGRARDTSPCSASGDPAGERPRKKKRGKSKEPGKKKTKEGRRKKSASPKRKRT